MENDKLEIVKEALNVIRCGWCEPAHDYIQKYGIKGIKPSTTLYYRHMSIAAHAHTIIEQEL